MRRLWLQFDSVAEVQILDEPNWVSL